MSEYTHMVTAPESFSLVQLQDDFKNAGVSEVKIYEKFGIAAAKLDESQKKELESKGYTIEDNGIQHAI